MALGKPAISDIRSLTDPGALRAVSTAISNIRQRIEGLEASLGTTSSIAQTTANASSLQLNNLTNEINALDSRVTALENALTTDIGSYVAGETIAAGQGVVGISSNTIGVADPSDPTRMFGLIGVALDSGSVGAAIRVQRRGVYTVAGSPAFTVGRAVYIGDSSLTQTPDYEATALPAGVAVSSTEVFITPDWPALLSATFSSAIEDEYQKYLPVTYNMLLGFDTGCQDCVLFDDTGRAILTDDGAALLIGH